MIWNYHYLLINSLPCVFQNASVIVGHPHLKLSFIWQQLLKLQRILSIISDGYVIRAFQSSDDLHNWFLFSSNFETNVGNGCQEISLCNAPLDKDDILQSITNLVSTKVYAIKRNDVVDLNDLRNFDFLDRLWDILSCKSVFLVNLSRCMQTYRATSNPTQIVSSGI